MSREIREKRREEKREREASQRIGNWKQPVGPNYGKNHDRIFRKGKNRRKAQGVADGR